MTEENTSVLKSRLGLDNLKGLGETLKQLKEVKESIDEAQSTLTALAQDNNPVGRALAQLIEAHGVKALTEDNINVLQEVKEKMEGELKDKDKTIEELAAENQGLKEDRVISEVTSKVTEELDKRLPQPGNRGNDTNGQGKLMSALEKVVADYMEKRLLGSGDPALTGEQIRSVVREEVERVAVPGKKPEDLVDDVVNAMTMGDRLKEKLGGAAGVGARLLQDQGGGSGLRTDLVKVLLEDERERLKITQNHEAETERNQHIGTMANALKDNLGTGIAAITAAAEEIKGGSESKKPETTPQVFRCGDCQQEFSAPAGWAGQSLTCPNPQCLRQYTKEELSA